MRSLAAKFALAFLIIGVVGALLVALFMRQQIEQAWDKFMFDPQRETPTLAGYYAATGDWESIDTFLAARNCDPQGPHLPTAVVDMNGEICYGEGDFVAGALVSDADLAEATPITVNGETVGWLLVGEEMLPADAPAPDNGDGFMGDLTRATIWSVLIASLIALLLGTWLARSLTHPIKELTGVTLRMSEGDLAHPRRQLLRPGIGDRQIHR
jgi:methyl-accepting chemotaxis protein